MPLLCRARLLLVRGLRPLFPVPPSSGPAYVVMRFASGYMRSSTTGAAIQTRRESV